MKKSIALNRKLTILCIFAFIGALGGLSWFLLVPHEPGYDGKPLSAWLDEWNRYILAWDQKSPDRPKRDRAQAALRQIGTNAIPTLLKMAGRKDPAWKKTLIAIANKQSLVRLRFQPPHYYHSKAANGFGALGPAAQPAIPALIGLLRDEDRDVRACAAFCLHEFGPSASNAVPALVEALNKEGNGWGMVLINSMLALRMIHSDSELVVPVLREYLDGPRKQWNYSTAAMGALWAYGAKAKSAVPAILPYLHHPDADKKAAAEAALSAIDPQAIAQAQQK
ncbi:MAG: HEAT repeat domain-containing protein [Limisphaerales bacterium]